MSRSLALAAVLLLPLIAFADTFSLSAKPGEFNAKTLGPAASKATISASMRLLQFNGAPGWPPAAYIGFHQGPDRNQSVQILIIRNNESDSYLVVGYRVIEGGKQTKVESIENLPLQSIVRVFLSFDRGLLTLKMNDRGPVTVRTPFTRVAPYVSVSSGSAEFKVDP